MKKIVSIFMLAAMLSATACGNGAQNNQVEEEAIEIVDSVAVDSTAVETVVESVE